MPPDEPPADPSETAAPPRRRLCALIPGDGEEPPADLDESSAASAWAVASGLWHPALLARLGGLPVFQDPEVVSMPDYGDVLVLAAGASDRLSADHASRVAGAGAAVVEAPATGDRGELIRRILHELDPGAELSGETLDDPLALDFLALGTSRWLVRDLTAAMGHVDCLDHDGLARESLAGARAFVEGDRNAAASHLRAAFELLTEARERFYPTDAYILDICLLDPNSPPGCLADPLAARVPFSVLGPARALEVQAAYAPQDVEALLKGVEEGWADVVGGAYEEVDEPLLPVESVLWQFRRGSETYRKHLGERDVETLARRRFGLYPLLPQVARRFGYRYGIHLGLDDGTFPVRPEAKRLWEAPDHSTLEVLTRPPLGADRALSGLQLPWLLGEGMKSDQTPTLPLAHWPEPVAGWYRDLRRAAAYSPVLARWATLSDYFHRTDRPYDTFRTAPDDYVTPYLAQAAARRDPAPISARARHARLRARLASQEGLRALALILHAATPDEDGAPADAIAAQIETGRLDDASAALDARESALAQSLAGVVASSDSANGPGFLILNPLGIARRAGVELPGAFDLGPKGPLRAAQPTEGGSLAVVDLPAFGFAWVPRTNASAPPSSAAGHGMAAKQVLRNGAIAVEIDAASGGIRAIRGADEEVARIGQQLVAVGGDDGPSAMVGESFAITHSGPALARAESRGQIRSASGRRLATFLQVTTLWAARPTLDLEITLADLDPAWLGQLASADPWESYLACRWAWSDSGADLRRTSFLAPVPTTAARPETPDAFEISIRRLRTALIFGGLAHHRRRGPRMLDTLLIAGAESAREFRLAVSLDLEHPHQAALDLLTPPVIVPTPGGPPSAGPTGWFFALEPASVAVTRVAPAPREPGDPLVLAFHLVETSGRACRARLRLLRNPSSARQVDYAGNLLADLPVEDDSVLIDLTPHELAEVEVTLGS